MTHEHGFHHIYMGPAELCPCPPMDEAFLVISGDATKTSATTFKRRSQANKRDKGLFMLTKGVIGQSGNEKNWYVFNESRLNGIFHEKLIDWCNSSIDTTMETAHKVKAEKLETYIKSSKLFETKNRPFRLIIALGDPLLILKRSKDLLQYCEIIDLSLHPLAMIWRESIGDFLSELNFREKSENSLLWLAEKSSSKEINPCENPSISEGFLDQSLQALIRNISLKQIRFAGKITTKQSNELQLLRSIVVDNLNIRIEPSITKLIRQRTSQNLRKIVKSYKKSSRTKAHKTLKVSPNNSTQTKTSARHHKITEQQLRGHIDGFKENITLHGWVDASNFGDEQSKIEIYWVEKNDLIGEALVNVDRPDLLTAGIKTSTCGFCAELKIFEKLTIAEILDQPISLKLIETKSGLTLENESWHLINSEKEIILNDILNRRLNSSRKNEITDYLLSSKNQYFLANIRAQIIKISSISFQIADYSGIKTCKNFEYLNTNRALDYGCLCESATRLELIFCSIISLFKTLDGDNILKYEEINSPESHNSPDIEWLNSQLQERVFLGLQAFENQIWIASLQPLINTLMATILLQSNINILNSAKNLIKTLAKLSEKTYSNPRLAFQLLSIIEADKQTISDSFIDLAQNRGDNFSYLVASFGKRLKQGCGIKDLYYFAAILDLSNNSIPLLQYIFSKQVDFLYPHLEENPRQSKPLHWLDRFGLMANRTTQQLINKMLEMNFSRKNVIQVHDQMIELKKHIAELLWNIKTPLSRKQISRTKPNKLKNWLIIGEKSLEQCWMYRVEQKKDQLVEYGCNVKTIDQINLSFWSFTHDFLWADAIIICRLAATYHVFRAIAYARSCNKKVYYEIDDLIFTPEYPADFESYGNAIPYSQYKNLCSDYPLRQGVMTYADEVIVSTPVLAELYNLCSKKSTNKVNILPNLPLKELNNIRDNLSENIENELNNRPTRIVITSGTLSHKNILIDTIFPVLIEILDQHRSVNLTVVGHINLPSEFNQYSKRIKQITFTDYKSYLSELRSSSIAIVPLEKHPTTDGKSAIKWMEASLCGVVTVCSPVMAYTDVATNEETALFAESREQWKEAINRLIKNKSLRNTIAINSFDLATKLFNEDISKQFWRRLINESLADNQADTKAKKVLLLNVFFAPQSVGGATRIAQDYALAMTKDTNNNYEVTVLCTDYEHWHADPNLAIKNNDNFTEIRSSYKDAFSLSETYWNGIRILRLCMPPKPWSQHYDREIELFCDQLFKQETFDLVQCHCCQILTAAPLIAAEKHSIPYEIVMHDGWWMSPEQFLVSPAGVVINPSDPMAHIDHVPSDEEKEEAYERRDILYKILEKAERRIAVSSSFKDICEQAGIKDIDVQENKFTPMNIINNNSEIRERNSQSINLCHIGGMSIHKGYQLLRNAVHLIPRDLPLHFTIVDHSLSDQSKQYYSDWNGYNVRFIAPIPMNQMPEFYSTQDVLIAPSIWPESFGLVSREALSAGLWVIASDAGALAEPLKNSPQRIGSVVIPNDAQDLADALRRVPEDIKTRSNNNSDDTHIHEMRGEA